MRGRSFLYIGNFLCAIHFFIVLYALAPYLATFIEQKYVGLVFSLGALMTLVAFPYTPKFVYRFGARRILVFLGALTIGTLLGLLLFPGALTAVLLIALLCSVQPLFMYLLDLLLEASISKESETGRTRALFMTAGNIALVIAPFLTGVLLGDTDRYSTLFLVGALSLIPFVALFCCAPISEKRPEHVHHLKLVIHCLLKDKDMRSVLLANATLQFFYHLAPFYIPLYLHSVLGIPWSTLGWMFTVMLIPFVVMEYPVGWLADKKVGDRELMALGFLLMGGSYAALAFVTQITPITTLLIILVLSRVGAATVEATAEGHFFRKVTASDSASVGILRMTRPISAVLAPLVGSAMLFVTGYDVSFLLLGLLVLTVGIISALSVRDIPQSGSV
jgi:MFS family permease